MSSENHRDDPPASIQDLIKNLPGSDSPALSADELMLQAAELSRRAAQKLIEERRQNRQREAESLLRRAQLPGRYVNATLESPAIQQAEAYATATDFVQNFDARLTSGAGMVLWGDVGTGKTHLACALANALRKKRKSVLYCTAIEAVMMIKTTWKNTPDGLTEYETYARFGEPELLIIDEIGMQMGSDFERMVLTNIADIRSRNCLPTVVISNLEPRGIYELLGERMFDRLVGFDADIVPMRGQSMRHSPEKLSAAK